MKEICSPLLSLLPFLLALVSPYTLWGQQYVQSVRGVIIDRYTLSQVKEAQINITSAEKEIFSTLTDSSGNFLFTEVPIGKYSLQILHANYEPFIIEDRKIDTGKEWFLQAELTPKTSFLETVAIEATKEENIHGIGVFTFDPDFSLKSSAGNFRDISRMLTRFPGISNPDDTRNDIVVRGNSPVGVLWKIEGIETINPNHLATLGNSGGGFNILNPFTLSDAKFYTGAFPAVYGNALSAVFDISLRNGNPNEFQAYTRTSIVDIEAGIEGPISKKNNSSYLLAYRRANLDLLADLIPPLEENVGSSPRVEDLTLKLHFPVKNGTWDIFAIGGSSNLNLKTTGFEEEQSRFRSTSFIAGIKRVFYPSPHSTLTVVAAISGLETDNGDKLFTQDTLINRRIRNLDTKLSFSASMKGRFSPKLTYSYGLDVHSIRSDLNRDFRSTIDDNQSLYLYKNDYLRAHGFMSLHWQLGPRLGISNGIHITYLDLNKSQNIEPRFSANYHLQEDLVLNLGLGIHSMTQPSSVYYAGLADREGNGIPYSLNLDLDMSKSVHYTASLEKAFKDKLTTKLEVYYLDHRLLADIPRIETDNSFSTLNYGHSYYEDLFFLGTIFLNSGTGNSKGIELTLEKTFKKDMYLLFTGTIYGSHYKGIDDISRPTAFNGNYAFTTIFSKEFSGKKNPNDFFRVNFSANLQGGRRYTDYIPRTNSLDEVNAFSMQYPAYSRFDLRLTYHKNFPTFTHEISLDIRNLFNRKNILYKDYDPLYDSYTDFYQIGFLPLLLYQINF